MADSQIRPADHGVEPREHRREVVPVPPFGARIRGRLIHHDSVQEEIPGGRDGKLDRFMANCLGCPLQSRGAAVDPVAGRQRTEPQRRDQQGACRETAPARLPSV
ncbi:hypothetical protein GCM10010402_18010 [Actinomadura luteofluorescens]